MQRKEDIDKDPINEKLYSNIGFYFLQPECFVLLYKPIDEKSCKNVDIPIIKAWID